MYEEDVSNSVELRQHSGGSGDHGSSIVKYLLLAVALIYVIASLYFMYTLKTRLDAVDAKQQALDSAETELAARLHTTKSEFKEALTSEVGLTKAEIARRAAELERQQKAARYRRIFIPSPAAKPHRRFHSTFNSPPGPNRNLPSRNPVANRARFWS